MNKPNLTPQLHKNNKNDKNKIFKIKVALSYFQINYSTTFPLLYRRQEHPLSVFNRSGSILLRQ